jgi:hypothetical protein
MAGVVCLYCKAPSKGKEEICAVCGMPLSMSNPEELFEGAKAPVAPARVRKTEKREDPRDSKLRNRVYAVLAISAVVCLLGIVLQRRSEIDQSKPENTRVILDQNVGKPKYDDLEVVNPNYEAARKAFNEGNWDEAERRLQKIPESDKDYPKARQLMRDIESERKQKRD